MSNSRNRTTPGNAATPICSLTTTGLDHTSIVRLDLLSSSLYFIFPNQPERGHHSFSLHTSAQKSTQKHTHGDMRTMCHTIMIGRVWCTQSPIKWYAKLSLDDLSFTRFFASSVWYLMAKHHRTCAVYDALIMSHQQLVLLTTNLCSWLCRSLADTQLSVFVFYRVSA